MSETGSQFKFSETHEWLVREEEDIAVIGISNHAQSLLGDIVYIELPEKGSLVAKADNIAIIESVKAASDIYAPLSGEVVAVNERVIASPELINESPYEAGWLIKIKISDFKELETLMDEEAYLSEYDS